VNLDTARQAEIMSAFEKGIELYQLQHTAGYTTLLDILEAEVVKYEFRLMNLAPGSDVKLLNDTHSHARVARSIFEQLQLRIQAMIDVGIEAQQAAQQLSAQADYNGL
jgi:hypothetical protein